VQQVEAVIDNTIVGRSVDGTSSMMRGRFRRSVPFADAYFLDDDSQPRLQITVPGLGATTGSAASSTKQPLSAS